MQDLFEHAVIADTHMHLYPCYETARLFDQLHRHMAALAPGAAQAAFLTEGRNVRAFDQLPGRVGGWTVTPTAEAGCLKAVREDGAEFYIVAGRQVVTRERVEVLALATTRTQPDGLSADETVANILGSGGVPVVSWAPGKWFLARGRVVRALVRAFGPGRLAVGDTSLRATCWPEPLLMRSARRRGMSVLAGSDPLPFAGEETQAGSYVTLFEGDVNPARPMSSLRGLLLAGAAVRNVGRRSGPLEMLLRLKQNAQAKA